jgi:type IV pilus assembly protein PilQ
MNTETKRPIAAQRRNVPPRERFVENAMTTSIRSWFLPLLAACTLATPALAAPGDGINDIARITIEETDHHTLIRIHGDEHPTFSVYRLQAPLRLFVDIAQSRLSESAPDMTVRNGVIDRVAAMTWNDSLTEVTRVVVGFDEDVTYDVTADGFDLVIEVEGSRRQMPSVAAASAADREYADALARVAALQGAVQDAERRAQSAEAAILSAQLREQQAHAARLAAESSQVAARQDSALQADRLREVDQARAQAEASIQALSADLRARDQQLQQLNSELRALRTAGADDATLARLGADRDREAAEAHALREMLTSLQQERDAALALARQADVVQASARQEREAMQEQLDSEQARYAALEQQHQDVARRLMAIEAQPAEVPSATQSAGPAVIRDVRFEQDGAVDRIVIEVAAGARFESQAWEQGRAGLNFAQAQLPDHLRRTLDTQAFGGPVQFVSSYTDESGVTRVVANLANAASEIVRQEPDRIVWEFSRAATPVAGTYTASPEVAPVYAGARTEQSMNSTLALQSARQTSPFQQRPRMTTKRITIDLRDADIQNVLRLLADEGNLNIVASDAVSGTITLRLRSVPLDEALTIILRSKGYGWVQEGTVLRVAPLEDFEDEYERYLERMQLEAGLEPLQVRLITLNYGLAGQMRLVVNSMLTSRGTAVPDLRSNTMVVTDVRSNLDAIEAVLRSLDTQTPQVLIEARIVETNDQFRRQLGIQWGGDFVADQSRGNATGLVFPSTIGIAGGATDAESPIAGSSANPNFAVNLPAAAGTGSGGAIGMTLGSLSGSFNLNIRLSAAETQGSAKIISAPRIMATHNMPATITSGVSIPVSVVSAAGAQTVFFDAALTLSVTPRVTSDGNIFLDVQVTKNEPDFENTGARGDPSIVRREATTQLLVRDGDTTVIGGIFQRNTGFSTDRVPFLGSMPILGPLFRSSSRTDVRNELLVFITPRIVNRDLSVDMQQNRADVQRPEN